MILGVLGQKGEKTVKVEIYDNSYKWIKAESRKVKIENNKIIFPVSSEKLNKNETYIIEVYINGKYVKNFTRKILSDKLEKNINCSGGVKLTQNLRTPKEGEGYIRNGKYD